VGADDDDGPIPAEIPHDRARPLDRRAVGESGAPELHHLLERHAPEA
jgi:hypothetical protein